MSTHMPLSSHERVGPFLERICGLAPVVAENRSAFDRDRRLPQLVFDALADAGLFRLWLPAVLGGPELSPLEFLTVVEAAAALDGSVGWLVGNGGGMSRVGGYLPAATAGQWFVDPHAFVASSTAAVGSALAVDGGFRVTGRWPFASGAHHATRFMALASVQDSGGRDGPPLCCYFTREAATIHDTWHVSGMRGSGSCEFEVHDVFVPTDWTHPLIGQNPTAPGLLYRMPGASVFQWTVSVVPLGIALGAIDSFRDLASRKARAGTTALPRDREVIQAMVGRVETLHAAARSLLVGTMSELMEATDIGGDRLIRARARFRAAAAHAAESAVKIVDTLAADAGAISIFETCPLERSVRDLHTAAKHIAMSPNNYIIAGRLALGLEPVSPKF